MSVLVLLPTLLLRAQYSLQHNCFVSCLSEYLKSKLSSNSRIEIKLVVWFFLNLKLNIFSSSLLPREQFKIIDLRLQYAGRPPHSDIGRQVRFEDPIRRYPWLHLKMKLHI